ncbi:MAG: 3-methylornithyl-N6-L-lysine dehydrogenase PylD [Desulfobacterales bacterium]|nr:3-methylornithyl-N6-L-lysine dehydrogenase PylD [Desulfobacterales bacterium]
MTRLTGSHIEETMAKLRQIDAELRERTGLDLKGVARRAIGIEDRKTNPRTQGAVLRAVPIRSGAGVIQGFAEAVCAIAAHVGVTSRVTRAADVAGMAEAYRSGAEILVMADDRRFVAINTRSGFFVDNDRATGEGFATLLGLMVPEIDGEPCGVIGCGQVGTYAALRLLRMGAEPVLCDIDDHRSAQAAAYLREAVGRDVRRIRDVATVLTRCRGVVDASPAGGIISAENLRPDTVVVAPGVPPGPTPEAVARLGRRFYHDNLPLGVATMVLAAIHGCIAEGPSITA